MWYRYRPAHLRLNQSSDNGFLPMQEYRNEFRRHPEEICARYCFVFSPNWNYWVCYRIFLGPKIGIKRWEPQETPKFWSSVRTVRKGAWSNFNGSTQGQIKVGTTKLFYCGYPYKSFHYRMIIGSCSQGSVYVVGVTRVKVLTVQTVHSQLSVVPVCAILFPDIVSRSLPGPHQEAV